MLTVMFHILHIVPSMLIAQQGLAPKKRHQLMDILVHEVKNIAIFTTDPNGLITSWNPGASDLIGYSSKDVLGQPLSYIFPSINTKNKLHRDLQTAIEVGQYTHETVIKTKNGNEIWVYCMITPLWEKKRKLLGFSKVVADITQKKNLDKDREEFLSIASHELKNPMTSILSYLQIMEMKLSSHAASDLLPYVTRTIAQVHKLVSLTNTLLNASRTTLGSLPYNESDVIDVDQFVRNIIDTMQPTIPHHIIRVKGQTNKKWKGDTTRLDEVISNVILNAAKYSPNNNDIVILLSSSPSSFCVAIQDFGIGMTDEETLKIFQRFQRLESAKNITQGLGLGLYLAREIVRHYNGNIWVKSERGKGSTFFIELPTNDKSLIS